MLGIFCQVGILLKVFLQVIEHFSALCSEVGVGEAFGHDVLRLVEPAKGAVTKGLARLIKERCETPVLGGFRSFDSCQFAKRGEKIDDLYQ